MIRRTALELDGLQNRLAVLGLVLRHHAVDVPIARQGRGRFEIHLLQAIEYARTDIRQDGAAFRGRWQDELSALPAWMFESD